MTSPGPTTGDCNRAPLPLSKLTDVQGENAMTLTPNSKDDRADVTLDKPPIQVTTWDYRRLSAVVDAYRLRGCEPLVDLLAEELDRAELVEPAAVPRDVVTMHSSVKFIDGNTGEVRV